MSKEFSKVIQLLTGQEPSELEFLLTFFLTISEKEALADRLQLIRLLLEGELSQREIASRCQLSIAKITRGSNMLKSLTSSQLTQLKALLLAAN